MDNDQTLRERAREAHQRAKQKAEATERENKERARKEGAEKLKKELKNILRVDVNPRDCRIDVEGLRFEIVDGVLTVSALCEQCLKTVSPKSIFSIEDLGRWLGGLEEIHLKHEGLE